MDLANTSNYFVFKNVDIATLNLHYYRLRCKELASQRESDKGSRTRCLTQMYLYSQVNIAGESEVLLL